MGGFLESEGGILRPRTREEEAFFRDRTLHAPVVVTDFLSSISQILSPRRQEEIRDLASLIAEEFEEHVDTRIRNSPELRVHRDADEFPHIQTQFAVELAYAYQLLNLFEPETFGVKYAEESQRLRQETGANLPAMPTVAFTAMLRTASIYYFSAALNSLKNWHTETPSPQLDANIRLTVNNAHEALKIYQKAKEIASSLQYNAKQERDLKKMLRQAGILGVANAIVEEHGGKIERGAAQEHIEWLLLGSYAASMQDILLGEMKCYALLGDYPNLLVTAASLEAYQKSGKYQPSLLIKEAAALIKQNAIDNQANGNEVAFVADSPRVLTDYINKILVDAGKRQSPILVPDDIFGTARKRHGIYVVGGRK